MESFETALASAITGLTPAGLHLERRRMSVAVTVKKDHGGKIDHPCSAGEYLESWMAGRPAVRDIADLRRGQEAGLRHKLSGRHPLFGIRRRPPSRRHGGRGSELG